MDKNFKKRLDAPNQSDSAILTTVEDLISIAMGAPDVNTVNFKMVQTVLYILARQMRILKHNVEFRITEERPPSPKRERKLKTRSKAKNMKYNTDDSSPAKSPKRHPKGQRKMHKGGTSASSDESGSADDKSDASIDRAEASRAKSAAAEKEKAERTDIKEREKAESAMSKERDSAARTASKEREKEKEKAKLAKMGERAESEKETEKAKLANAEEREREKAAKDEAKLAKMNEKERAKAAKDKAKLAKMNEKEKQEKEKEEREKAKLAKAEKRARDKAEKEKAKLARMNEKERVKHLKEKEKEEKEIANLERAKEKEREKAKMANMNEKERATYIKEKEEREKAEKEKAMLANMDEEERAEYMRKKTAKEKEKFQNELDEQIGVKEKTGISVTERDKILVVEKGPTTRHDSRTRVGSIEVVTASQFELLESMVIELQKKAAPLPLPAMPDNQRLRKELAEGSASLSDTMHAMQVTARVQAVEAAIGRMAELLTELAAAGVLPRGVAARVEEVVAGEGGKTHSDFKGRSLVQLKAPRTSTPTTGTATASSVAGALTPSKSPATATPATATPATAGSSSAEDLVTVTQGPDVLNLIEVVKSWTAFSDALRVLKEEMMKHINLLASKANHTADAASSAARHVADQMDIALQLDVRLNQLNSLVNDYADQLKGFDAGITIPLKSFQEQMNQLRIELKAGIATLESAHDDSESAALTELHVRYEDLLIELEMTLHAHTGLTSLQAQLSDELKSLLQCVETLREQKADRDEVFDGLRDKADMSRLDGLLKETDFAGARAELDAKLEHCHSKFKKQEAVWMNAIQDLVEVTGDKSDVLELYTMKEETESQLREVDDMLQKLVLLLGDPKAALLTRQLSVGARCGACQVPALQQPVDPDHGRPPALPALGRAAPGPPAPCEPAFKLPHPPDEREHICHRWVGGSHTLIDSRVRELAAPVQLPLPPTNKYTGYGDDGRLYMLEEPLQPCLECNQLAPAADCAAGDPAAAGAAASSRGAGDVGVQKTDVEYCE